MIGPDFAGHDYPLPYRRYIKLGLFLTIVAINVYLTAQYRRIQREKLREEHAEYRRLRG